MQITGTHFNYLHLCSAKLWLFLNGITMEHTSDLVYEGKLIHETAYPQRSERYEELEIEGIKIDFYDTRNKVIHEIKKSDKMEKAHEWQLKYYIYVLERNGIEGVTGILEYPVLRHTEQICLSEIDREYIVDCIKSIQKIADSEQCPSMSEKRICKNCSYYEFCFIREEDQV